jgi:hypothetical protein
MSRYTFSMSKGLIWVLILGCAAGVAWGIAWARRRLEDQRHEEQARAATFLAGQMGRSAAAPAAAAVPAAIAAPQERMLFEAASKAAEAGEPALCIQLYARLIARYPKSALLPQARAAVEAQKKKLAIPRAPGTTAPG